MDDQTKKRRSFKSPRLSKHKKKQIASLYNDKVCPSRISKMLHITGKTVYSYLDKFGLRKSNIGTGIRRKYVINDNYFNLLDTTEKVYWLGYLVAHANLSKDMKVLYIEVSAKDLFHLQNLLLAMG